MNGGDPGDSPQGMPAAPPPAPADVGIVAAMSVEVGFLLDRMSKLRKYVGPRHSVIEGECGGKLVALMIAGLGRENARRGTQILLDGHRPRWVVSAGFAGALNPEFSRLEIALAKDVIDLDGHRYAIDVSVPPDAPGPRIRTGRLLTVDRIIRTAAEKAELHREYEADLVDMETSGVAALCSARSVRFLSIRVISDDAQVDLPPEIAALMTRSGSYRVGAALRAIWHRPSSLKDFWALHEQAQEAADRLATFTAAAIERLE